MRGFLSVSHHKIDKKGRVSVPVSFRINLLAEEQRSFICFPSLLGNWLQAVTPAQMQAFIEQQDKLGAFAGEPNAYASVLFAQAVELIPDSDGRIVLSPELLAHARIGEDVVFAGQGHFFNLWAPDIFTAQQADLRARALAGRADWLSPSIRQAGGGNG